MQDQTFQKYVKQYLSKQREELSLLEQFKCGNWTIIEFNCGNISPELYQDLCEKLKAEGIGPGTPVLYYFQLANPMDSRKILDAVSRMKADVPHIALARYNKVKDEHISEILYLGKTRKGFFARLKQHLGLSNTRTYSLQLKEWAQEMQLVVRIYCLAYPLDKVPLDILDRVEDLLHEHMRPIMGKRGGLG